MAYEENWELTVGRRIVCAAIERDGLVYSVARPGRHGDIIRKMAFAGIETPINWEQGFLTSDGVFVGRRLALLIATRADQIIKKSGNQNSNELFSEDVW